MAAAPPEFLLSAPRAFARQAIRGLLGALLLLPLAGIAAAPPLEPGVSLLLAQWRAQHYRDVHYTLDIDLQPGAARIDGSIEIRVTTSGDADDLVLDWRGARAEERVRDILVNGLPALGVRFIADHLVIPGLLLEKGENHIAMRFQSPVGVTGSAITRYIDREDGAEYLYTLLVPSDASTVFPCFDQPDLKARFTVSLRAPQDWRVIANAPLHGMFSEGANTRHRFAQTEPISTYLFAFAAGPFVEIVESGTPSPVRLYARRTRVDYARREAPALLRLNRAAMHWFAEYFAQPFPFAKYDLVLVPELAYGGMEHAGATFLREESVLFPFDPGTADLLRRANLLLHETSHQWFGDLVTMRWFDDLWLKEGFANLMASKALDALQPELSAWVAFHSLKTTAYRTDVTRGTTPIRQVMDNLSSAKSAYGNIVYGKAPAVLRQAEFFVGEGKFRDAVRDFLKRHAYAAAGWEDLVLALERASGTKMHAWANAWVERRGMPQVRVLPQLDKAGNLRAMVIEQRAIGGEASNRTFSWPMKLRVYSLASGRARIHEVSLQGPRVRLATPGAGKHQFIFANLGDYGYGQFLLDAASQKYLLAHPQALRDDLLRSQVHESLWEAVREAELDPARYIGLLLAQLPGERNDIIAAVLLARLRSASLRYLGESKRAALAPRIEDFLFAQLQAAPGNGRRIEYFRAFADLARSANGRARLKDLLANRTTVAGVQLRSRDRFRMLQSLLAADDADGPRLLNELSAADTSNEGRRYSFAAAAAVPDAGSKRALYTRFMEDPRLPEAWIEEALGPLNFPEHAVLTAPLLEDALAALPRLKRERKIFFVGAWLENFIGGQTSRASIQVVERFLAGNKLAGSALDEDLRLKVLESLDTLERTVRVTEKFGAP